MTRQLEPVEIELKQGRNTFSLHRGHYYMRGITICGFILTVRPRQGLCQSDGRN
jgi:hypothetical protein